MIPMEMHKLITPKTLIHTFPLSDATLDFIKRARDSVIAILEKRDPRLLVIVGPCSIHDTKACLEYAYRLSRLRLLYSDSLYIVMRVYFEKPRTIRGWKGLIGDPALDGTFKMNEGLYLARKFLIELARMGLPAASECVDTLTPHYISDLLTWVAIGARTSESQTHRELASFFTLPVGFKNTTDGNIQIAIDAVKAAAYPQQFVSINAEGHPVYYKTAGNPHCHIILRGSKTTPNYQAPILKATEGLLKQSDLPTRFIVDCSHGNSLKNPLRQIRVMHELLQYKKIDELGSLVGVMLESHLKEGSQMIKRSNQLIYGKSITDACLGWTDTEMLLEKVAHHFRIELANTRRLKRCYDATRPC